MVWARATYSKVLLATIQENPAAISVAISGIVWMPLNYGRASDPSPGRSLPSEMTAQMTAA